MIHCDWIFCLCVCPAAEQASAAERSASSGPGELSSEEQPAAPQQGDGAGDLLQGADREEVQERVVHQRSED